MSHEIPGRPWEFVGTDFFAINNRHYLCVVDYHIKFLVVKQMEGFSVDSLINTCKIIFLEYGLHRKIVSDVGTNLISEKTFCGQLNICHAPWLSYNHQSKRQAEVCIKLVKRTTKNCHKTNADICLYCR